MVDLVDAGDGVAHQAGIEHRALNILHLVDHVGRAADVEHTDLGAPRCQRRDKVVSDKTAAAGDEDFHYGREC